MMFYARFFIFIISFFLGLSAFATPPEGSVVSQIEKLLKDEEVIQPKLQEKLRETLLNMQSVPLNLKNKDFDSALSTLKEKVEENQKNIAENLLRINFLISLRDALTANPIGDIKKDIPKVLSELAARQLIADAELLSESTTWLFEINLSIAVRDLYEPIENFGDFLRSYMVFSSLSSPVSPTGFLKDRTYIGK